jgi:coenzyme F420-reducing hydrogenase alpha subunit
MSKDINIHVEHLTRVEGHGNIILNAKDNKVEKVMWEVSEAPRLFEAFVRGKPYHQLAQITSRICGICSIGHTLASLKATEAAMGIEISEQSQKLRRLAIHGENMQSHILHVGYLVAPDLFGAGSVIPMVSTHTDAVLAIVKLHRIANDYSDMICGRTTHPTNLVPGGLYKTPSPLKLKEHRQKLLDSVETTNAVAEIVLANAGALPNFVRETEFIGLTAKNEYALYDGLIGSTDAGTYKVDDYKGVVNEFVVPQSTAKYCKNKRDSYMVGALARFNLNYDQLSPMAKEWAKKFGLKPVCHNPFMNSVAQLIEFVNSIEDSIKIIDDLLDGDYVDEPRPKVKPKAGQGVGAVDVPRGILIHDYTYDKNGICTKANCVIPTNMNHNNIQHDFEAFAPTLLNKPEKQIELNLEMLVRAYDPCISCSTHFLKVDWKR